MTRPITRRGALMATLFGGGMLGLRALATGLPVSFLMNPRKALGDQPDAAPSCGTPQYIILSTSTLGDPINCNVPGTYLPQYTNVVHSADPSMAPTNLTLSGVKTIAAAPWATLPQTVLDRACFFHVMTNTPVHPKEPEVLQLVGATASIGGSPEMLPSLMARQLQPCLKTLQAQPISVGAISANEMMKFGGAPQPTIPPVSLKATLINPSGELTNLQALRDDTLTSLYGLYRTSAGPAQKTYLDSVITSQQQVRGVRQDLLAKLGALTDNGQDSQILAAIILIQMSVAPVIAVHLDFGGDNHSDPSLANEAQQTVASLATLGSLMSQLAAAGLTDSVSFLSLNVFGRTLGPGNAGSAGDQGRQHNPNHQVSLAIGKPFKGGVIGGIGPVASDYGALAIDSKSGQGSVSGDITAVDSLASFGKTVLSAVGASADVVSTQITSGSVITAALA